MTTLDESEVLRLKIKVCSRIDIMSFNRFCGKVIKLIVCK
jgi:hypothetical protein